MTLILSCLTDCYAIQVSDRRLSLQDGSPYDDNSNKAILLNGNVAFGYTGLAFLNNGKVRTDDWFLDALNDAYKSSPNSSLTDTAEYVANLATKALSNIDASPEVKRLAFVGVGWGKVSEEQDLRPIYIIISNCHNSKGRWLSQAQSTFSVLPFTPPDNLPVMLVSDGQPLGDKAFKKRVLRLLNTCLSRGLSPNTMSRILVATVRHVASSNPLVGKNLLVSSIPKKSVRPGSFALIGHTPLNQRQTFTYVPENTSLQVQYGPYAFAYGVSMKELRVFYLHPKIGLKPPTL